MSDTTPESPLTDVLRAAIAGSGLPMLRISTESGVQRASLIRFMRGETSLRLDMADKLAAYFGLELKPAKPAKPAKIVKSRTSRKGK